MKTPAFIFVLGSLIFAIAACTSDISKEAIHEIDDLLARRMEVVAHQIELDNSLRTKEKYNREITDELERSKLHLEYVQEKYELMTVVKTEIDAGYEDMKLMIEKYPEGKPGHTLILAFKNHFEAYKVFMDVMVPYLNNQINTCILYNSIVSLETNQQLFFDALDNNDVQQAQTLYDEEEKILENYESEFELVDFKGKIPIEWATEFKDTYVKMHEWLRKFLQAKKQKDEALYKKLRLEGFELVFKIPYAKTEKLRNEIEYILFEYDPDVEALEKKSADAGLEAYTLYYEQKMELGEDISDSLGNK